MNKKLIGILLCILFFGASVTPVLSGNVEKKNVVENKVFIKNPPKEEWNVTFGGIKNDRANCVQQTYDGGYVIVANTSSFGSGPKKAWVIKTNETGDHTWNTTKGADYYLLGYFINQTSNGDYIITGGKGMSGVHRNFWIWKLNESGNDIWEDNFGDTWSETGYCGRETSDGNLIFVGTDRGPGDDNDVWLIKTDINGVRKWESNPRIFGNGYDSEIGRSVIETEDGGYIISGFSHKSDGTDVWLIKTDVDGNMQWNRFFRESEYQKSHSVQQTQDGGYILCGRKMDRFGYYDVWILKTNDTGIHMWNRTFGGNGNDRGWCLKKTCDGGFIIVGDTNSTGAGDIDIWLIKTNETGFMEWNMTFGGRNTDYGRSVWVTNDGGYIIAGSTNSSGNGELDVWLIKIAPEIITQPDLECNGELIWKSSKPISTKTGSFTVENIGDSESSLNWEIVEWPEWGYWTFTPISGIDLTPEDGKITVNVSLVPPKQMTFEFEEEFNRGYTGEIKIVNIENSSDYCTIPVYLRTQRNKVVNSYFQCLEKILLNPHNIFNI